MSSLGKVRSRARRNGKTTFYLDFGAACSRRFVTSHRGLPITTQPQAEAILQRIHQLVAAG